MLLNSWVLFSLSHPICLRLAISNSGATGAPKRSATNHPIFLIHLCPSSRLTARVLNEPGSCSYGGWHLQNHHSLFPITYMQGKKIKTAVKTFYQILEKQKERTYFDMLFSSNTYSHLSFCRGKKKRLFSITMKLHWSCIAKIHKIM